MDDPRANKTRLDWSKLLGFDQIKIAGHAQLTLSDLGFSKIGAKSCTRLRPDSDPR